MSTNEFKYNKTEILKIQTSSDFAKYVELYGEERAQGYLDAIRHAVRDVDRMFAYRNRSLILVGSNPAEVTKQYREYVSEKRELSSAIGNEFTPKYWL